VIWTIAKKELRGYFSSAVALVFLGAFVTVTLLTFFWWEKFFARGLADLRPLFDRLPMLLIILVSALSMRQWAEERAAGTLEILLTLPVERWKLVAGKFLAGMLLVAIALGLTLGIPITVSMMGNLDTGPVIGGYLAALLLAAAYLVIGMCISAVTDLQIVAFVLTGIACAVTYVIGEPVFGDLGRALGTGARFQSVARGVLDLRDLAYYGGIVVIGMAINVLLLGWLGRGRAGAARRAAGLLSFGLVVGNVAALMLWLAPVRGARIDLTHDGAYSLSGAVTNLLDDLDEPLVIHAYLSERTHPKLQALIPQLRDLLDEFRAVGGGKIRVEIDDPTDSDVLKREAKERYDIEPRPLQFATASEKSVVNTYFSIAIEYGNRHEVLGLDDLIQVRAVDMDAVDVTLKNPEYAITKAIKKAVSSFASVDNVFAQAPGSIKLTAYLTPDSLPDGLKEAPAAVKAALDELAKTANGKLEVTQIAPTDDAQKLALFKSYGLRPYRDLPSGREYYYGFLLQYGERVVRLEPPEAVTATAVKTTLLDGLKHVVPGFIRVVGMWTPPGGGEPQYPGMPPQGPPPPQQFNLLRRDLLENYEVRDIQLAARIPDEIEVLLLCGPANLDARAAEVIDQFVMRGGSLIVLGGRYRLAPSQGIDIEKVSTGLEPLLAAWGVTLFDQLVRDPKSDTFPTPHRRELGDGMVVDELVQKPYPLFVKATGNQLSAQSLITSGVAGAVVHFAAPVDAKAQLGDDVRVVEELVRTSDGAQLTTSTQAEPDYEKYPEGLAPIDGDRGSRVLAVSVTGGFPTSTPATALGGRRLEHSPPDTRLVVFGSSAFVSDDILRLAQQIGSDLAASNVQLVHNAVDWALDDTGLLAIRNRASARVLTVDPDDYMLWRVANFAIAFVALLALVGGSLFRRYRVVSVLRGTKS
jgi:ABC-2 type transport system permease protein